MFTGICGDITQNKRHDKSSFLCDAVRAGELGGERPTQHIGSAHVFTPPPLAPSEEPPKPGNLNQTRYTAQWTTRGMNERGSLGSRRGPRLAPQPNSLNHWNNAQQACHPSISHMSRKHLKAVRARQVLLSMKPHKKQSRGTPVSTELSTS